MFVIRSKIHSRASLKSLGATVLLLLFLSQGPIVALHAQGYGENFVIDSLITDKTSYDAGEVVQIWGRVKWTSGTKSFQVAARFKIRTPSGSLIDVGRDIWNFVDEGRAGFLRGAWVVPTGAEKGSYGISMYAWIATSSKILYNRRVMSTIVSFTVRSGDLQYPSESWNRIWYVYSGSPADPWVQFLDCTEDEPDLNFDSDWGRGSVKYGLSDQIGTVMSRVVTMPPGSWTFTVGGDDGIRLYIDGELVISKWKDQSYTTYTHTRTFATAANHLLRLEWYENEGDAYVSFDMRPSGNVHDGPET